VLQTARKTGGTVASVPEEEVAEGIRLLARTEGIFTETAGGVTVGVLAKLAAQGVFKPGERVVALITGMGLKTIEAVSDRGRPTVTIDPSFDEFRDRISRGEIPDGEDR
jgi:threonine synthase